MSVSLPNSGRSFSRRALRIILIGSALSLVPFVVLGAVALSYLGLHRDAAALRKQMISATPPGWSTRVQFNVGESTIGAADIGLRFVRNANLSQAREFLGAVKRASVGVYQRETSLANWSRTQLFAMTDQAMEKRGWTRLVGVADGKSIVLVYGPDQKSDDQRVDVCIGVIDDKNMVVVSARLDAVALDDLVGRHGLGRLPHGRFLTAQK